jgi:glycosyltransferase involved in cell wall biosynthesis
LQVLIAHNDYGKFSGEEQAVETAAGVLSENGHLVRWLRESSAGIESSFSGKIDAFFSAFYSRGARRKMAELLDRFPIDLVQVQNLYPFLSPSILIPCRERGVSAVMRCPNYRLFCPNGLHLSQGEVCERCLGGREWHCILRNCVDDYAKSVGYALRNAFARVSGMIVDNVSVFVVLSEFQKKRFVEGGIPAERIEILPNIAPRVDSDVGKDAGGDAVSFIGRMSPEKGVATFLGAAQSLGHLKFLVAGEQRAGYDAGVPIPGNVSILGFLTGAAFDRVFRSSRILVFPSIWYEGFPNVIAQAMAHGRPVVASRLGAIPEIVDDGVTGLLFEPGNAQDFADKIDYLWNRPELCREMGRAGREKALREYSKERFYERLMAIYAKAGKMSG